MNFLNKKYHFFIINYQIYWLYLLCLCYIEFYQFQIYLDSLTNNTNISYVYVLLKYELH